METFYNVTQFSNLINVKVKTLQKWDREGVLVAKRTPTNRRYYTHSQYLEYIGEKSEKISKKRCIYARVSTRNQKDDLQNQLTIITNYMHNRGISVDEIYTDYGSGMNYKRQSWNRLIDDCIDGNVSQIYIAHKDRFVRFGFEWIAGLLSTRFGVEFIILNDTISSPEEELVNDLVSIIHVFSGRVYGLRKYKKNIKSDFNVKGGDDSGEDY